MISWDRLASFILGLEESVGATWDIPLVNCEPSGGQAYYLVWAVDAVGLRPEDSQRVGQFRKEQSIPEENWVSSATLGRQ